MKKMANIISISLLALSVQACTTVPQPTFTTSRQGGITQVKPLNPVYQYGSPAPNVCLIGGNKSLPADQAEETVEEGVLLEEGQSQTADRTLELLKDFVGPVLIALIGRS